MENNVPTFIVRSHSSEGEANLNPYAMQHIINFGHSVVVNTYANRIETPLFIKLTIIYNTMGTFENPEEYFELNIQRKTSSYIRMENYDPNKKLLIHFNIDNIASQLFEYRLLQIKRIPNDNPQLELTCNYQFVTLQGEPFINKTISKTLIFRKE